MKDNNTSSIEVPGFNAVTNLSHVYKKCVFRLPDRAKDHKSEEGDQI